MSNQPSYARIILPLAIRDLLTYRIPEEMADVILPGMQVEVPLGNRKLYSGIVFDLMEELELDFTPKYIIEILERKQLVGEKLLKFMVWLADYYNCTIGEVLTAILPSTLRLQSETLISLAEGIMIDHSVLKEKESKIIDRLERSRVLTLDDIRDLLDQQSVFRIVNGLMNKGYVVIHENLEKQYKPKKIKMLRMAQKLAEDEEQLTEAIKAIEKYDKQLDAVLALIDKAGLEGEISRKAFLKSGRVSPSSVKSLIDKGIIESLDVTISRLSEQKGGDEKSLPELTDWQGEALLSVRSGIQEGKVVMLHGITGSGKTEIYIHLIREQLELGKQVLYLLPEIGLTSQLLRRLKNVFGEDVLPYHSRINEQRRTEIWNRAAKDRIMIVGARSAALLPYNNLGLVVIDESHDQSFKQHDPAPRYHGRDAAIFLAQLHGAGVVMGTATPSLESIYNVKAGKYHYVRMDRRYGDFTEPEIDIVDMRKETVSTDLDVQISKSLLESLNECMANEQQVILFRNRRGYAPRLVCRNCGWHAECVNCDIALTYHKPSNQLRCHFCGYRRQPDVQCPSCGQKALYLKGYGTQKVEEYLELTFPDMKIARMDLDTTRSAAKLENLLKSFELGEIDVLVGTQMVTKGLDFDNVGLVCILNADGLLYWPDFRANERAFQLMVQVAGRAGRKTATSKVLVQTYNPDHPVIQDVKDRDFSKFYARELEERRQLLYPPFVRLIKLQLRHKDHKVLNQAVYFLDNYLRPKFGHKINGPASPPVARVRSQYLVDFFIKIPKHSPQRSQMLAYINRSVERMKAKKEFKSVRVVFDVDPV